MFTLAQDGTVESLLSNILVALDSYEVGEIKAKMLRGRLAKAEQGGYAGGRVPYGYTCQRHTNSWSCMNRKPKQSGPCLFCSRKIREQVIVNWLQF